ncbi:hypothetical protein [Pelagibius sp. Alg239-R121]|uniref:hypothetical protein n=1 Tax=Pelagibius sp. Alg239-R121 TaxID=2993448 RepID=UPI0024A73369|nr:hypothetical protein [Pelagibius sp. Alg239-R121]
MKSFALFLMVAVFFATAQLAGADPAMNGKWMGKLEYKNVLGYSTVEKFAYEFSGDGTYKSLEEYAQHTRTGVHKHSHKVRYAGTWKVQGKQFRFTPSNSQVLEMESSFFNREGFEDQMQNMLNMTFEYEIVSRNDRQIKLHDRDSDKKFTLEKQE